MVYFSPPCFKHINVMGRTATKLLFSVLEPAMALQKVLEYMLPTDRFYGAKSQKIVHHCFHSLLEVMVDLKELTETSDSDEDDEEEDDEDDEEDDSDEVRG